MNGMKRFEALAAHARLDEAPKIDVAAAVLRRIQQTRTIHSRPFWTFSGCAVLAAAAMVMIAFTLPHTSAQVDAQAELFPSFASGDL